MPEPAVSILYGEDEFGVAEFIQKLADGLGDPTMAEVNTSRLDGRTNTLDELVTAVSAMPFLTPYRLVVFNRPLEKIRGNATNLQNKLTSIILNTPPSTRLVLVHDHLLTEERDRKKNKIHWLEAWALEHTEHVRLLAYPVPVGGLLTKWIQERAKVHQGQLTLQAANTLSDHVGPDLRVLDQEIQKLLAFVNYARPVDGDDVIELTPRTARVGDFALVNAIRNRDGRQALAILRRELEEEEPRLIFASIVNQFRTLLQTREIIENRGREEDVARLLGIHPFAAKMNVEHARRFSLADLEAIYRRLLEIDFAMKTSAMEDDLALDVLITELTRKV